MIDDRRLEAILAAIGNDLDLDSAPLPAPSASNRWRRPLVAAAAVVAVLAVIMAVAPSRRAVTGWLHLGRTEIEVDPGVPADFDDLPSFVVDTPPISANAAAARIGTAVPDLAGSSLGEPVAWLAPDEGGAVAVWSDGTSLWLLPIDPGEMFFEKTVRVATDARDVAGLGEAAVLVTGDHVFETPLRRVHAGQVLLWMDGDLAYRLESPLPADELIAAARSILPASGERLR